MRVHVAVFPVVAAIVRADASAELTVNGISKPVLATTVDEARRTIISEVAVLASKMQRPVRLDTTDGLKSYQLAVHPNGHVTVLDNSGHTDVVEDSYAALVSEVPASPPKEMPRARDLTADIVAPPAAQHVTLRPAVSEPPVEIENTVLVSSGTIESAPVLELSTRELVIVSGNGVLGRAPAVEVGEHVDHILTIHDPDKTLSRTHLAFGLTPTGGVWVSDRGSANGTWFVNTNGTESRLSPGVSQPLLPGTRVEYGVHWLTLSEEPQL